MKTSYKLKGPTGGGHTNEDRKEEKGVLFRRGAHGGALRRTHQESRTSGNTHTDIHVKHRFKALERV